MSTDWRELLDRALDGDELSEADARALAGALAAAEGRREAAEWLGFDVALRARLAPASAALSRERLLAKAALREKAQATARAAGPRRLGWRITAAAVLAVVAGWLLLRSGYPEPQASGDYRIVRGGLTASRALPPRRGDALVVGAGGARLSLGGYCELDLDPDAELVVRGEPRSESVELRRGRAVSRVIPERGEFTLLTPLGSLEVRGTEFVTTVGSPDGQKGGRTMDRLRKTVVTVLVVSGAVAFQFGGETGILGAGASKVFAGEAELGVPDALKGFRGMLIGVIARKGEREFIIEVQKITKTWKGNKAENPKAAVGKKVVCELWPKSRLYEKQLKTLAGLKAGDRVLVEPFHLEPEHDHLTVVEDLRKLEEETKPDEPGDGPVGVPEALRGFKGMLTGTIVKKGAEEFILKVEKINRTWKGNKAKNPQAAVGKQVVCQLWKKGRLYEKQRRTLAELKAGDRVLCEPFHLEADHDHLTVVEELRKAD